MESVINVYKPQGVTPLQSVRKLKSLYTSVKNKKIAYAGRLDPMAEGVLVLLIEPETKRASRYQRLDKEYVFEVLFGVETDSFDVLGIVQEAKLQGKNPSKKEVKEALKEFIGKRQQAFPPFSSKPVKGKPLYWWAREGKLGEIEIPAKAIEVYSIELVDMYFVDRSDLEERVMNNIGLVEGDFRQEKIKGSWERFFKKSKKGKFKVVKVKIHCSSGTYVRSIANELGKKLGIGSIAYSILRTRVGDFELKDSMRLT